MKMELLLLLVAVLSRGVNGQTYSYMVRASPAHGHGRFVVNHYGQTLTVCSDGWTDVGARNLCRHFGWKDGLATTLPKSNHTTVCFNKNTEWLYNCSLPANEQEKDTSAACSAPNATDAAVLCFKDVKLGNHNITSTTITGTLSLWDLNESKWRGVCGLLGPKELQVVCRELNYSHGLFLTPDPYAEFEGLSIICHGYENSVTECYRIYRGCHHDVRIMCYNRQGDEEWTWSMDQGRVHVTHMGITGTVCSEGWNNAAAMALCREHGKKGGVAVHVSQGIRNNYPMLVSSVTCPQGASNMSRCYLELAVTLECQLFSFPAEVVCTETPELQIEIESTLPGHGRLVVQEDWELGAVCGEGWNDEDAIVACRTLGFQHGNGVTFPKTERATFMSDVRCNGQENSLFHCPYHDKGNHSTTTLCSGPNATEAGVMCFNNVRLSDGQVKDEERMGGLEMYYEGRWVGVCDSAITDHDAEIACQDLDQEYVYARASKATGTRDTPIIITAIICHGMEDSIIQCTINDTGSCPSGHHASIQCRKSPFPEGNNHPDTAGLSMSSKRAVTLGVTIPVVVVAIMFIVVVVVLKKRLPLIIFRRFTDEEELTTPKPSVSSVSQLEGLEQSGPGLSVSMSQLQPQTRY